MNPSFSNRFVALPWESHFVERFPGDPEKKNFVRIVREVLYSEVIPTPVRAPKLLGWSDALANDLGIARPSTQDRESLDLLAGNSVTSRMRPYAARYGGHQFGHWAGQLGDGRAITLGEVRFETAGKLEFQLKGAGPTPYARRADGRAVLRSSVREFLCSEAMHFLGVPTTRALSLVLTGDEVVRDMFYNGNPRPEPGAVVCRVSPTFLRFGNFEILAANGELPLLQNLADYLVQEHYPELHSGDSDIYGKLLDEIARRTATMVAHWMRVGFVHGVMNTDNMSALGVTIDYGPYGWLELYDPNWTPNTTDAENRRYRFGNQPGIAQWNLARLCEAFFPLIRDEDRLNAVLATFRETFGTAHARMLAHKLGWESMDPLQDGPLVEELFQLLGLSQADYTIFFRALCEWKPSAENLFRVISPSFYADETVQAGLKDRWSAWEKSYSQRLRQEGRQDDSRSEKMKRVNPKYVLRNYLAQNAIVAAEKGDASGIERLVRVLKTPYDDLPGEEDLAAKRPEWATRTPGCSALSCSS